jgi:endonuclease G
MKYTYRPLILLAVAGFLLLAGWLARTNKSETEAKAEPSASMEQATKIKKPKSQTDSVRNLIEVPAPLANSADKAKPAELIVVHKAYTLSFNTQTNEPNWVAWELTEHETEGTLGRSNDFEPDPTIPTEHQVYSYDYKGSGYDRGHMAPAADMKWNPQVMAECFYMSNMCPQIHALNDGGWKRLEDACRRWAEKYGNIYIVCGPIFDKEKVAETIGVDHQVMVPEAFFKAIVCLQDGHQMGIGFIFENSEIKQTLGGTATTIDAVEGATGYDLFPNLPDDLEKELESQCNLTKWN